MPALGLGFAAALLIAVRSMTSASMQVCGAEGACAVQGGSYRVRPPAGWDGRSALPALVFFHGWRQSAEDVMRDETMTRVMSDLGVLLVAPDGAGHSWSFPNSPAHNRDEFAFLDAVLDDVEARYPVDQRRLWASGFSQGGSMVWYAACFLGGRFVAFVPIAGDFWQPQPENCPSGPASIRHFHGLADETFPIHGRVVAEGARQGDLWQGWALWRRIDGCTGPPDRTEAAGDMSCQIWSASNCSSGRELALCLHRGGHIFSAEWLREAYRWVIALMPAQPPRSMRPAARP
jgi:polyhydroxybutyrate depolymerase